MSVFGLGPMVGPCIGPIIGGLLAQRFGWQCVAPSSSSSALFPRSDAALVRHRSLFWFLFAFGAFALVLIVLFLPETLRSLVGNGSIPARGINRSLVSVWQEHQRRKRAGKDGAEPDEASLAARPPKKGWRDVRPFAPLKMFLEKDVFLTCARAFARSLRDVPADCTSARHAASRSIRCAIREFDTLAS